MIFQFAREQAWFWRFDGVLLNTNMCAWGALAVEERQVTHRAKRREVLIEEKEAQRPKRAALTIPTVDEIKRARRNALLSAREAGELLAMTGRQWQKYEAGQASINPALWLQFCIATGQIAPSIP